MGLLDGLSKLVSGAAKTVVPKILVGGTKSERTAVQSAVKTGFADPIFDKFGDTVATNLKLTAGIVAGALGAGKLLEAGPKPTEAITSQNLLDQIGKPTITPGSNAGIGGALLKSNTVQPVGLLDTLTKGINKVDALSKTTLGGQLIGTLGKFVTNLATPPAGKPSDIPQQLALQQGTRQYTPETSSQAAVFQGRGVRVEIGNGSSNNSTQDTWWNKNKSWALPVLLGVPGFFLFLFMLFGGRRRR